MTILQRPAHQEPHNLFRPAGDPKGRHSGEDYGWASGDDILAAAAGVVSYVYTDTGDNQGWGRRVVITHAPGVATSYNHMKPGGVHVAYGETVKAGQHIGDMGESGKAPNGRHLHFELYIDGVRVDPRPYFSRHLPGTGPVVGEPSGTPATAGKAQRVVRHPVRRRQAPTSKSKNVTTPNALLTPGTVGNFDGFIRGQMVELNGIRSRIWYRGISGDWFWAGNFTEISADGLADLGTYKPPAKTTTKPKAKAKKLHLPAYYWYDHPNDAANHADPHGKGPGETMLSGTYTVLDISDRGAFYVRSAANGLVWVSPIAKKYLR